MALYARLMSLEEPRIPIHQFQSTVAEWARGRITGTQANTIIAAVSGAPLTPAEVTEATTLVGTVPTGGTTAQQAARALRLLEIDQILMLAENRVPQYDTAALVKAKLGV